MKERQSARKDAQSRPVGDREPQGLTSGEVAQRHADGQSNFVPRSTSRPVTEIIRANLFTLFNAILGTAAITVLLLGDWRDAVFGIVLVSNIIIGMFSELRAKHMLDSVAVLDSPSSNVWRDGQLQSVDTSDLVVDDVVLLRLGDQIPADGETLDARGLEVDESILTGESVPVRKKPGERLLSGTSVVAGTGSMLVQFIGADAWAQKISAEAKQFSLAVSEIQQSINRVLTWITMVLPIIIILLAWSQTRAEGGDWRVAVVLAVAGVVGMVPQGLVLLTSLNFGIAAANLSRRGVLVQELPAVEILARVNELCVDKTGTLTTGGIRGEELVPIGNEQIADSTRAALSALTSDRSNASAIAVQDLLTAEGPDEAKGADVPESALIPFNSQRKWSALNGREESWILGAPEILLEKQNSPEAGEALRVVADASKKGRRTLCLAKSKQQATADEPLPENLEPALIVILAEELRPDAAETLEYFREQKVRVRVISGDSPDTVGALADQLGLAGESDLKVLDARQLPEVDSREFDEMAADIDVFGRVTPEQKRALVRSLQRQERTVAMTGDGVNDALALKEADLGISMGSGAQATKAVSRMVLMDDEFSVLPGVVAEGRRIIANMERVSVLFLSKTMYAMVLAVFVSLVAWVYPFLPRHLTYIGTFTIGVPAFFLALAPATRPYRPGFLRRTLALAVPSGIALAAAALISYHLIGEDTIPGQTAATLTLIIGALWLLSITARPLNWWRLLLLSLMAAGAVLGVLIEPIRTFFALEWPNSGQWAVILVVGIASAAAIELIYRYTKRFRSERE